MIHDLTVDVFSMHLQCRASSGRSRIQNGVLAIVQHRQLRCQVHSISLWQTA